MHDGADHHHLTALVHDDRGFAFLEELMSTGEWPGQRDFNAYYLAEQMGYEWQDVSRPLQAATARTFLRAFGRRMDACELLPADLCAGRAARRLRAAVDLAECLVRAAFDPKVRGAIVDDGVQAYLELVAERSSEDVHCEDEAIFPERLDRAVARSLIHLAENLGYVLEPSIGGTDTYEAHLTMDARDAGWFVLELLHLVELG